MNKLPTTEAVAGKSNLKKSYLNALLSIIILLSLIIGTISINRYFDKDEFEHIHSAWYVENGYTPYSDFFQHHHPFLWYFMLPFLFIWGHTVKTVIILRIFVLILLAGIVTMTYLIAQKTTNSSETGLLSVVLLLSMVMFIEKGIEIRPDLPQVLFGLISVYFLIIFFQNGNNRHLIFSGLSASISFLFLQKSIFLLFSYGVIFLYKIVKRRMTVKSFFLFSGVFLLPLFLFWQGLIISGSFNDYLLTNWTLNLYHPDTFSPLKALVPSLIQNQFFWVMSTFSLGLILLNKVNDDLRMITFIGLVLLSSVFLVRSPYRQYFMFAIPFLCIDSGYALSFIVSKYDLKEIQKMLLTLLLLPCPLFFLLRMSVNSNYSQLKTVDFVLKNSNSSDSVYDGNVRFNLFRHDLHYFWYSIGGKGVFTIYNKLTEDKYGDYDIHKLIIRKRPQFISDYELNIDESGLGKLYDKTGYEKLYIRKAQRPF